MVRKKTGDTGKDRQKKAAGEGKKHPDQAAAEREEKQTRQENQAPPSTGLPDLPVEKDPEKEDAHREETDDLFPVIGIGASAGGLEALETLLSNVPEKSGMAFVIISHTDPARVSLLPEILRRKSQIPVLSIEEGMEIRPDTAYVPPSDKDLIVKSGAFCLEARQRRDALHMPIDRFLRSLAEDRGERSGCIILSGTGTDGTQGLRIIKEKAGVVVSQNPESARHSGMPRSAIDTGLVDFVLAPEEIAKELIRYFEHPGRIESESKGKDAPPKELQKILSFLANRTRHDFSLYKKSTLIRRIERRMSITRSQNGSEYLSFLHRNPQEVEILFEDLLINVTNFFRDPEAFAFLREEVLPDLVGRAGKGQTLRIWIPGCSTGEEAYSVAMIVQETIEELDISQRMQIFATDLDKKAIEKARAGVYVENIATDVSPERLSRFFVKEDHLYRVRKDIRESIIFAVQNVLSDPPFSNLDLLVCRNLLIYLEAEAQQKLIPLFHYTLRSGGVLFLGTSESVGRFGDLFEPINKKQSLYRKKDVNSGFRPMVEFPTRTYHLESARIGGDTRADQGIGIAQAAERVLLQRHTPASVVVDRDGNILHVHGRTGKYLEQPEGKPSLGILEMSREGLRFALSSALRKAASSGEEARQENLRVRTNGDFQYLNLIVTPLSQPPALKNTFMIVFEDCESLSEKEIEAAGKHRTGDRNGHVIELERELSRVQEQYQGSLEELESSNEELRSVNEELHSSNEELQSTNEELESSREELQSLNEELSTVNSELHSKIQELAESYGTITAVLDSTHIAILFLDRDLRVKRFTNEAAKLINLIDSDVGRPIDHISHNLECDRFTEKIHQVLETLTPVEDDVRTRDGHWYRMRIMVYRTREHVIDGAVATFFNIDAQKKAQAEIEEKISGSVSK
ncbi:MAG: PAS domain-containing protein [Deltaproteobacteria bacterium]|nr:PAS domain-containing protein [Deltaproteobacteria bacterium]